MILFIWIKQQHINQKDASQNNPISLVFKGISEKYDGNNYYIKPVTLENIPGKIKQKSVSITFNKSITKYYDGTTEVKGITDGNVQLEGVIDGEHLIPHIQSIQYKKPDVDSYAFVDYHITLEAGENTNIDNYQDTVDGTKFGSITKPMFTITAVKTLEKEYDGTKEYQWNTNDFKVSIENSTQEYTIKSATLTFDKAGVDASKVVMSNIEIEGADLTFQDIPQTVELSGKITPRQVTLTPISLAQVTKVYDGTTDASLEINKHLYVRRNYHW